MKYPNAVFFGERTRPAHRAEGDLLTGALHFESVSGFQVQLFPQRFGDDNAACFINDQTCVHSGTILWVEPTVNTILLYLGFVKRTSAGHAAPILFTLLYVY
jgi:hypothetical protein